jgi:hypothetical protein
VRTEEVVVAKIPTGSLPAAAGKRQAGKTGVRAPGFWPQPYCLLHFPIVWDRMMALQTERGYSVAVSTISERLVTTAEVGLPMPQRISTLWEPGGTLGTTQ